MSVRRPLDTNISESNNIMVELLITDSKTAMTLLDLAETTRNAQSRSRRITEAKEAYRSILSFLPRVRPTADQAEMLSKGLETLKARLEAIDASI